MNLTLSQQPAFSQVAQSALNTGAVLTAAIMQALNENAKFAVARSEEFYGFYVNGQTVVLPVSPLDGYTYARNELSYLCCPYWTGAMLTALEGGVADAGIDSDGGTIPPYRGYASGPGCLTRVQMTVNQSTGVVGSTMTYGLNILGEPVAANDGVVLVMTIARRLR